MTLYQVLHELQILVGVRRIDLDHVDEVAHV